VTFVTDLRRADIAMPVNAARPANTAQAQSACLNPAATAMSGETNPATNAEVETEPARLPIAA